MAIFRAETKSISRAKGHNLVAAVAYRAGMQLTDTNELNAKATTHDYTKKTDVVHSEILIPALLKKKLDDADIALDFQYIANLVEVSETTKRGKMKNSARLGREWVLCGVPELTREENIELFQEFAKQQSEQQNVVSMCFVHDPKAGNDTRSKAGAASGRVKDERNIHAHIVLLTRKLELTESNELQLTDKSDSELSNDERTRPVVPTELVGTIDPATGAKIQQGRGLCSNSEWLKNTRESWADILNKKLIEKGVQPVTHKSYRELGVDIMPTVHVGNNEQSDDKRALNERINNRNESAIKSAADSCIDKSSESVRVNQQRLDDTASTDRRQAAQRLADSQQRLDESARAIKQSDISYHRAAEFQSATTETSDRASERIRERERLTASSARKQHFYQRAVEQTTSSYENNINVVASRLAWRKEHSKKYDERQMQELDAFYKTLNIRDFTIATNSNSDDYIAPQNWSDAVKDKLTADDIINNPHIIAIIRDPITERENRISKTFKFDDRQSLTSEVIQTPSNESKTSQSEDLTPSKHGNSFRPR